MRLKLCAVLLLLVTSACEGTGVGRTLFGTPSNNTVSTITLSFPTKPNRALGVQVLPITVNAYDRWGNPILVTSTNSITLSSTGTQCEVGFAFAVTPPGVATYYAALSFNQSQPSISVQFDPTCGGPNPVAITASAPGATSTTISF